MLEVIQRGELLGRLSKQVRKEAVGLGEDAGLVMIQIDSFESGVKRTLDLVLRDHLPTKRFRNINKAVEAISNLTYEELNDVEYSFTGGVDGGRGWKGDVKFMRLDIKELMKHGWTPQYTSRRAIKETAAWLHKNSE